MSEFNYLREKARMTKYVGRQNGVCDTHCECIKCPLFVENNSLLVNCAVLEMSYPEEATRIVRKWAKEHPVKTRKDVLLEKFPNAILNDNGCPAACAKDLGLTQGCCLDDWCKDCWDTEVEE